MFNNYLLILVSAKIFFVGLTMYFFVVYLQWDMFTYPDFYTIYGNCSEKAYTNILFSNLFCKLSLFFDTAPTFKSLFFIFMAASLNMLMLVGYFKIFEQYLKKHGKYLLIILLVSHPYLNIYFFRFYTDLFASLGIFLIVFYKIKNINLDILFLLTSLMLMNFRNALIPVFFVYGLLEIYSQIKKRNHKSIFYAFILLSFSIVAYLPSAKFGIQFLNINADISFLEKIINNIILALGYRESIGISREIFIFDSLIDVLSFIVSLIFILIHSTGLFGIIKFSFDRNKSILIIFVYLILPILAIAHLRYLLPLIPVLLFGYAYLFFGTVKIENDTNQK